MAGISGSMYATQKAKKATPIICSPIPRNQWNAGKVKRATEDYGRWAAEIAQSEKIPFIDLNTMVADHYDILGAGKVSGFFYGDHTHTNQDGALLNAEAVMKGIRSLNNVALKNYSFPRIDR